MPPMPSSTPDQMKAAVAGGRPHELSSASHMAYWIWEDQDQVWHLRVTTQRVRHRFEGVLRPLSGTAITDLVPVAPKRHDELAIGDGEVAFDFHPHEDVDGIDFRLAGPPALELALRIDGDYDPTHIWVGQTRLQPREAHFLLLP
jgi:hypothetical protein